MKLTKSTVEALPVPQLEEGGYKYLLYYDELLRGFGVRANSKGKKTFFVEKRSQGKLHRISLGAFGDITAESARRQAQNLLGQLAVGIDPLAEKRRNKIKTATLREVFNEYIEVRSSLKPSTIEDYKGVLHQVLSDWLDKPLTDINRDLVAKRHAEYGKNASRARANYAMRVLRAIFNFAMNQYQDSNGESLISDNPVCRLSGTRAWYKIERKQSVIKPHQLAKWYEGVVKMTKSFPRRADNASLWHDYFLFLLFTGLRQNEASSLAWDNVDLLAKTFQLIDTKNRSTHTLPISDFVYEILQGRRKSTESNFVFPSNSEEGYVIDHRKAMWKVTELSGIEFKLHDLRRTFITIAESLDIPAYALKRLLNHKVHSDVTSGYIISDVERLRKPMQKISNFLLKSIKGVEFQNDPVELNYLLNDDLMGQLCRILKMENPSLFKQMMVEAKITDSSVFLKRMHEAVEMILLKPET